MLRAAGYETTVIDYSSSQLEMLRKFDTKVYFGDATRPDLLHAAGIANAKLFVVAIDNADQATEVVRYAAKEFPDLHILARARNRHHVYELYSAGCRDIIRETYDSSIRAGRSALEALGLPNEQAAHMASEFEAMDRQSMIELASLYRLDVPATENEPYVKRVREIMVEWEDQLRGKMWKTGDAATDRERRSGKRCTRRPQGARSGRNPGLICPFFQWLDDCSGIRNVCLPGARKPLAPRLRAGPARGRNPLFRMRDSFRADASWGL